MQKPKSDGILKNRVLLDDSVCFLVDTHSKYIFSDNPVQHIPLPEPTPDVLHALRSCFSLQKMYKKLEFLLPPKQLQRRETSPLYTYIQRSEEIFFSFSGRDIDVMNQHLRDKEFSMFSQNEKQDIIDCAVLACKYLLTVHPDIERHAELFRAKFGIIVLSPKAAARVLLPGVPIE